MMKVTHQESLLDVVEPNCYVYHKSELMTLDTPVKDLFAPYNKNTIIHVYDNPIQTAIDTAYALYESLDTLTDFKSISMTRLYFIHPVFKFMEAYFEFVRDNTAFCVFGDIKVPVKDLSKCFRFLQQRGYFDGLNPIYSPQSTVFKVAVCTKCADTFKKVVTIVSNATRYPNIKFGMV